MVTTVSPRSDDEVNFGDLFLVLQSNVTPAMQRDLAESLGVTIESIQLVAPGYYPADSVWVTPERTPDGRICGLIKRLPSGKKIAWTGSTRGLAFLPEDFPQVTPQYSDLHFIRINEANFPCPICGREKDGCLISLDDAGNPVDAICVRTPEGSVRELPSGAGFLHNVRKPQTSPVSSKSLGATVLILEGWSDFVAAKGLGFRAVAHPSAQSGAGMLTRLLRGQNVDAVVVGDNDAPGRQGVETIFENIKSVCHSTIKVFPPPQFKDLRAANPTRDVFDRWVSETGSRQSDSNLLPCDDPLSMVDYWLSETQTNGSGQRLLWRVNGIYYRWRAAYYEAVEHDQLGSWLYGFFGDKRIKIPTSGGGVKIQRVKLGRHLVGDLDDALRGRCYKHVDPNVVEPFPLSGGTLINLSRSIIFGNGIYDLNTDKLSPLTPDIFVSSTLPYEFDRKAKCELFLGAANQIFNGDQESIELLQEWFGYNLIASNHMQAMMFFFGVPGSGKSTLAGVLRTLLGSVRCCGASTDNFKSLFGKETLLNKYSAIMSESRDTNRSDIDKLLQTWKAITGGDVLNVSRKYRQAVDARLFCRLTYVANDVIPFDDTSHALASRTNLLYFPNNFRAKKPDRMLDVKLAAEVPGIALWAIEGLKRLLVNDKFTIPKVSEDHLNYAEAIADPLGVFFAECTEVAPTLETPSEYLFDLWQAWSKRTGHFVPGMNDTKFGRQLRQHIPAVQRNRVMTDGKREYKYYGIGIVPGVMEHYCLPVTYS